jgi:hypothetical protein
MPTETTVVPGPSNYIWQIRHNCGPWVLSNPSGSGYTSYSRTYNNPQHRVKPDPLTDTALAKQSKWRSKPSISNRVVQTTKVTDYSCAFPYPNCSRAIESWGIVETTPTVPSYSLDWQSAILQQIAREYVNLGSSLAEYRSTVSMFAGYAEAIKNAWQSYRGLKKFRPHMTPCSVPAAELAYSFGIKPLTEDMFSYMEALRLKLEAPIFKRCFKTATAFGIQTVSDTSAIKQKTRRYRISNRVSVKVKLDPASSAITWGNPSTWAWELIPFSFVVDWGIPIGQYLADLDTLKKINYVSGTRTIKEHVTTKAKSYILSGSGPAALGNWGHFVYQSHQRVLVTSLTPPLPRWKPSASWAKAYRAVSLLIAVNQPCRKYSGRRR